MRPVTPFMALASWRFAVAPTTALVALGAAYLAGVAVAGRRHRRRRWPARWSASFLAGLCAIAVAMDGSPGVYDDALLTAHMVQHLLLIMVAPPLLVAGRPATLLLHATRGRWHGRVRGLLRSPPATAFTWPPGTVIGYSAVVAGTHLTGLIAARGMSHDAEHAAYLAAGYLLFHAVLGGEPGPWRLSPLGRYLLLLAAMPADIGTAAALMLHPGMAGYPAAGVHAAGMVMLAGGDLIMTALAVVLAVPVVRARPVNDRPVNDRTVNDRAVNDSREADRLAAYNAGLAALGRPPGQPLAAPERGFKPR